ncbi:helix-turn-helix domain-containing protein [Microbulbifer pacificus]|uniref:Helix-turn-helix domain-containing protein n=1 Tax=Microbulbifer pacificus TaxID=407164 RepID=A0AAU0N1U1_9GAMM|nr:helix-turn-helix domain-containing protein [Microbulbifer pacificus]WOX06999.1 helix-turn-helix domain-containing protein [Microbulbifer pacificus]
MRTQKTPIPLFKLYGETDASWPTPDLIHCETIAERSRLYDWTIKPHRHSDLVHLLYCQSGDGQVSLDGVTQPLRTPCVVLTAPMSVHGFEFSHDVEGYVVTLAPPLLKQLRSTLGNQQSLLQNSYYLDAQAERSVFDNLFATLNHEYANWAQGREVLIEATVNALMILLGRHVSARAEKTSLTPDRGSQHYAGFMRKVEQCYRRHDSIEVYAEELGITAAHLNTLCRRFAERSAQQLIHERLLLEAKRNLIYTALTISQISDSLGFNEPAYFTRFFKRLAGTSPREFRRRSQA